MGDWVQLSDFFKFLTNLDPKYPPYAIKLAQYQMALGHYQEAIQAVNVLQYDHDWKAQAEKIVREANQKGTSVAKGDTMVPLIPHGSGFLVDVMINQKVSARLMLDTGATLSIVTATVAEQVNRYASSQGIFETIQTANGRVEIPVVTLGELAVQNRVQSAFRVGIIKDVEFTGFDGLLGMDFLKNYQFVIDPTDKRLYLSNVI
ncbi:MAG: clan AA aspartic protease [Magnetococcales bacterium]|nr:clan AA aspartic protease [Magnetococcales bacterium]